MPVKKPWILIIALLVSPWLPLVAQPAFEITLPSSFPLDPAGPVFTARDGIAVTDGTSLHVISGLPLPSNVTTQVITPTGGQAMSGLWSKLSEDAAVYCATSGELILVRDLPANPTLISTGLVPGPCGFQAVNDSTAVHVDFLADRFLVLRHDAFGATVHTVNSPVPLTVTPGFGRGTSGPCRYLVMGDPSLREVVMLEGLDGPAAGFSATTITLQPPGTTGTQLQGFFITESGTGIAWEHLDLVSTELSLLQFPGGIPHQRRFLAVASGLFAPGGGQDPQPASGDNIILTWNDDVYIEQRLVIDTDQFSSIAAGWCNQELLCRVPYSVAEDELVLGRFANTLNFTHQIFSGPDQGTKMMPLFVSGSPLTEEFWRPNENTLVYLATTAVDYSLIVYENVHGTPVPRPYQNLFFSGTPRFLSLDPGLGALLVDTGSPKLQIFVLGSVGYVGAAPGIGSLHLYAETTQASIGQPFGLTAWVWSPGGPASPPSLGVSLRLGEPFWPGPPFQITSRLDLDLEAFLGLVPATPYGAPSTPYPNLWSFDLGLQSFPPELTGLPLYCQAVTERFGTWYLSRTMLVVPR